MEIGEYIRTKKGIIAKVDAIYEYWQPNENHQSYINPANEYDKYGKQKRCKSRLEEIK